MTGFMFYLLVHFFVLCIEIIFTCEYFVGGVYYEGCFGALDFLAMDSLRVLPTLLVLAISISGFNLPWGFLFSGLVIYRCSSGNWM